MIRRILYCSLVLLCPFFMTVQGQIKNIDIVQREYAEVTIFGTELQPGMYKYALIADGQIIGTETMILTD